MKKSYGILGIIVLIILCCLWAKGAYNGMYRALTSVEPT